MTHSPESIYRGLLENPDAISALVELGQRGMGITDSAIYEAVEINKRLREVGPLITGNEAISKAPANNIRRLAWIIALLNAGVRRERWRCTHALGLDRNTIFLLSEGLIFCVECAEEGETYLRQEDDGHCDICDEETTVFYEFAQQDLLGVYTGNMCESCHQFHKRLMQEEAG